MEILRVVAFILCLVSVCSSLSVLVLEPKKSSKPEAALVIVPGAHIRGLAYKPLAETIQKRSDFKLYVALLDGFINHLPNIIQLPFAFNEAVVALAAAGYRGKSVFLGGHSLGGAMSALFSERKNPLLEGVVLFSAYPMEPLQKYPLPVLTISGDLDGLTRVTKIADAFENLQKIQSKHESQKYKTPVVVLKGVNHGLVASGIMPSNVKEHDLTPEMCEFAAHDELAKYTNAFLVTVRNDSKTDIKSAMGLLDTGYTLTSEIMQPLLSIKALDQNDEWVSHWTITAQQLVVSLKDTSSVQFVNYEDESQTLKTLFRQNNPFLTNDDDGSEKSNSSDNDEDDVTIQSHTTLTLPGFDGTDPVSPLQLKATMTSQEAVKIMLPNNTFGTPLTCKEINQEAFTMAYVKASPIAKTRYTSKKKKSIYFEEDKEITAEMWPHASLHLTYNKTGLFVQSEKYLFNANTSTAQTDCSLLSPYRAMEWIYIDSLRTRSPTHS